MSDHDPHRIIADLVESAEVAHHPGRTWKPGDPKPSAAELGRVYGDWRQRAQSAADEAVARRDASQPKAGPPPFKFTLFDQIDPAPRKEWLVRRALGAGELSIVYGDPGCGKSVFVTDLAFHVATGADWFGRGVKGGSVMYVAAERAKLTERRLAALRAKHELAEPKLAVLDGRFDLFAGEDHARRLVSTAQAIERATGEPVILIIVDTVARVIPGADENASRDIGRFIDNIDLLRRETGAHVLAVHHSGKDETKRMRGSTALLGAADTTIVIKKDDGGLRTATIDKSNDDGEGDCFAFKLESVDLFVDPEMEEVIPTALMTDRYGPIGASRLI